MQGVTRGESVPCRRIAVCARRAGRRGSSCVDVIVIDDDPSLRRTIRATLETQLHRVAEAANGAEVLKLLGSKTFEVALLDLRLGQESGLDLLSELLRHAPDISVVIITAYATIETAVEAMRRGAADYLPKPFTPGQLRTVLYRVGEVRLLQSRVAALEERFRSVAPEADLKTLEPLVQRELDLAFRAAESDASLLLRGESGTGKGILARAVHARSKRSEGPFVTVPCPCLSAELLESDLFGHVRGAFTGAIGDKRGKVAAAQGGTLFLDEIGDLPLALQPKLLRLLQEKCYERVGDTRTCFADVRILAATNRNLEAAVAASTFREDLLYRLNVIEVTMPPLRQRPRDILPLAENLLGFFAQQTGKPVSGFTDEARDALRRHSWPGNIRELRNAVERGVILSSAEHVGLADLPVQVGAPPRPGVEVGSRVTIEELEIEHIRRVLGATATIEEAAIVLGINPSTLFRKRKLY